MLTKPSVQSLLLNFLNEEQKKLKIVTVNRAIFPTNDSATW
jgi:hypothetical protein